MRDVPAPVWKGAGAYALLRPHTLGLCRTDLYVANDTISLARPMILGHEFVATVLKTGDKCSRVHEGDRVAVNPLLPEGFMGLHTDGALCDEVVLPEDHLYIVPPRLPAALAAYFEPVAAALAVEKVLPSLEGDGVIIGRNRIADLTQQILQSLNKSIPIISAKDLQTTPNNVYDFVIEAGLADLDFHRLISVLRPGGRLIMKSRYTKPVSIIPSYLVGKDITIQAVAYGDWNHVLPWIEQHQSRLLPLVGVTYPLTEWADAFAAAQGTETAKVFIQL